MVIFLRNQSLSLYVAVRLISRKSKPGRYSLVICTHKIRVAKSQNCFAVSRSGFENNEHSNPSITNNHVIHDGAITHSPISHAKSTGRLIQSIRLLKPPSEQDMIHSALQYSYLGELFKAVTFFVSNYSR